MVRPIRQKILPPIVAAILALIGPHLTRAAEPPAPASPGAPASFPRVDVAPTKTSIYIGTVSLTMPPFARKNGGFESTYVAKVFPYFFSNETGSLRIEFSDAQLQQLARGERVAFTGRAQRSDGAERRIEGHATPADARSGKIKVRVFYSARVELIFNTTYRFPDP